MSTVELLAVDGGDFQLVFSWPATSRIEAGRHVVPVTRKTVMGATASLLPLQQRPVKKICRFTDDIILEVLRARGVR